MPNPDRSAKRTRSRVAYLIGYSVLIAMLAYLVSRADLRAAIGQITVPAAIGILVVATAGLVTLGWQFKAASALLGIRLQPREWLGLTAVNTVVSFAVPARGGLVVRAAYLKRVHDMRLEDYAALTIATLGLTIGSAAAVGLAVGVFAIGQEGRAEVVALFGIPVVALLLGAGLVLFRKFEKDGTFGRIGSGLRLLLRGKAATIELAVATLAFVAIQGFGLLLAFRAVGSPISVPAAFAVYAATVVAFVLAFTPGGLGIKEGAAVFVTGLLGLDTGLALTAALVDRAAVIVPTAIVAFLMGRPLLRAAIDNPTDSMASR